MPASKPKLVLVIIPVLLLIIALVNLVHVVKYGLELSSADTAGDPAGLRLTVRALTTNGISLVVLSALATGLLRRRRWALVAAVTVLAAHYVTVVIWRLSALLHSTTAGSIEWTGFFIGLVFLTIIYGGLIGPLLLPSTRTACRR